MVTPINMCRIEVRLTSRGNFIDDLKGRLIKIKDNKWAAEMEAEFYVQCGC